MSCGAHGQCEDATGVASCLCDTGYSGDTCAECAEGYQDNDGDGQCFADCTGSGLSCGDYGACDDSSGTVACVCDTGHAGQRCELCALGYQDDDQDGSCESSCAAAGLDCGSHGLCSQLGGAPTCVCHTGYTGVDCGDCAGGFQDNDSDGTCLPDCATAGLACGANGVCNDADGNAQCDCDPEYAGADCSLCASGYQDHDGDGACAPDCSSAALSCASNGYCDDDSGTASCTCFVGYDGVACTGCATGFQDSDGDGACLPDCATAGLDCGVYGSCDDSAGSAVCDCLAEYTGAECTVCAPGYQDNDQDGACSASCASAGLDCGMFGYCNDVSGTALCVCLLGYTGQDCSACDTGYQDNDGNGTCQTTCALANPSCGGHGSCDDSGGTAVCDCDAGYAGSDCTLCAAGYQDHDNDGTCAQACTTAGLDCGAHGSCTDASGTAQCDCALGYAGPDCILCDTGYQDDDGDGLCQLECATAPWWNAAYGGRISLELANHEVSPMANGTLVYTHFDHASLVADGRSLANGDDVRIVYWNGSAHVELPRTTATPWNGTSTSLVFLLQGEIAGGDVSRDYWLYFDNSTPATPQLLMPPTLPNGWLIQSNDPTKSLRCGQAHDYFYSIQLRQIGANRFQVHLFDGTFDGAAYGRITVVDDLSAMTIVDTTYGDYGTYSVPGTHDAELVINATAITVTLESREFSASRRYFGCEQFYTGNPPTSQIGITTRSYVLSSSPTYPSASLCGL